MADRYRESARLLERVLATVPLGTQTFSKSPLQFPRGQAPHFLREGLGGRVWDVDGNEYVDVMAALLAVMLGYRDPDVDAAIRHQLGRGISFSLATELEGLLAERLVDLIPGAEMVRFAKNGSDVTSAAIRVARAATGRDRVVAIGYHGWQDWYIGATTRHKGVPAAVRELTHRPAYNDLEALRALFEAYPAQIAAVILEPAHIQLPAPGYLQSVRELTRAHGAVLVFDEIVTGFRLHRGGAQSLYGVTADLVCFGKALGNGMPLAALAGRRALMREFEDVFVSGTFGGEALSLAAGLAVLDKLEREPVIDTLWATGDALRAGMAESIGSHDLAHVLGIAGPAPMQSLTFADHPHASADAVRTLCVTTLLAQGILTIGPLNVMYAHDAADVTQVLAAFDRTCRRIAEELQQPGLAGRLDCPLMQPVFAVRGP